MIVFQDIMTEDKDDLFTDAYKYIEVDDIVYEVDGALTTIKEGDVDIGANPSAEEQQEALEDGAKTVINIVYSPGLVQTQFDKKSFLTYIKQYMKAIKGKLQESNPERVAKFEKGAQAYVKKIIAEFKDYEFYTTKSMDPNGMVILLNYRSDGITPYLTFWIDGAKAVKY